MSFQFRFSHRSSLFALAAGVILLRAASLTAEPPATTDASPWGIATGGEDSGKYPQFNPLLEKAGGSWLRYFTEWEHVQSEPGKWKWDWSDKFVVDCREHRLSVSGIWMYFAPWASADGKGTRVFPIKDIGYFRDFVRESATRYKDDIRYWEVWNEMNSPAFNTRGTTKDYADLVRAAYEEAHKVDPRIKVGLTVAAHDLHWLNQAIEDGATDHFDFVCVHPYNSVGLLYTTEQSFLTLRGSIRKMLDSHGQRKDIEIWISEIGQTTNGSPEQMARQAEALTKSYVLGIAQGFDKVFWFEAMGGKYNEGVHAIIDQEYKPYPAYYALQAMTGAMGRYPKYQGWLNLGGNSYGFVFDSPEVGPSLALWSVTGGMELPVEAPVSVTDSAGKKTEVPAGGKLALTRMPVFVKNLPEKWLAEARENRVKPYPWTPDYRGADTVSIKLGPVNQENGIRQGNNDPREDGTTIPGTDGGGGYRSTDLGHKRPFIYFEADRSFMDWGDRACEITVTARRADPKVPSTVALVYESETGYHEYGKSAFWPGMNRELLRESEDFRAPELWSLEKGEGWQTKTWRIKDASFIGKWGWNFQLSVEPSAGDVWVKDVSIKRLPN